MKIELTDDGTMDTVLRCTDCGEEFRFSQPEPDPDTDETCSHGLVDGCMDCYDEWIAEIIDETANEHECSDDCDDDEPTEDDITTTDHEKFYQYGRLVLSHAANGVWYAHSAKFPAGQSIGSFGDDHKRALRAYMNREQFFPAVYFISDHGNAHLIDLSDR